LDFGNWEEEKLWAVDLPVTTLSTVDLEWLLDCPFWEHDNGERYTITPRDVLEKAEGTSKEQQAVEQADTTYPIDVYFNNDKYLILDGIHRLVNLYQSGETTFKVRVMPDDKLPLILSGEPIELPDWS
jgi:hypothetical protein